MLELSMCPKSYVGLHSHALIRLPRYVSCTLQFYGACMMGDEPMLLVEYCEGGDLRQALSLDNSTKVQLPLAI